MYHARFGTAVLIDAERHCAMYFSRRRHCSSPVCTGARSRNCDQAGGHHAAGYASTDGGVLLDLSGLRAIEINLEERYAVAQAGLTWAHFDQVTQAFGLMVHVTMFVATRRAS
jgi:hypothetical protein